MADLPGSSSASTAWYTLSTFTALCIAYVVYYRLLHPLASYPGPFVCSLTDLWKLRTVARRRMADEIVILHQRYGPVVRVGPEDLSFNSADAIDDIYKKGWQKGAFYRSLDRPEPTLSTIRDNRLHAERKRMFSLGLSMSSIRSMEYIIDTRYAILRQQMDRFARSQEIFDLRKYISFCIVDILGELAFGSDFGNQVSEDPKKIPPVSEALFGAVLAGQAPWLTSSFAFMRDKLPTSSMKEVIAAFDALVPVAKSAIKQREEKGVERLDILGRLMAAREEKSGQPLTIEQLVSESVTLILGGTHTTSNTLHILFANLSRSPAHLKRVVDELDANLPPLKPSQAAYSINGLEEKLDFVSIAIKESHRRDPVATFNMPRVVPETGAVVAGFKVPPGAQVFANIHALHHNPATWGEDHDVFDPNRFYDERARDLKDLVVPFSVGKRSCVGQNLANANVLKMTTTLLRAYEFDFVNADEPMRVVCHGDSELETRIMVKCKMRGDPFQS